MYLSFCGLVAFLVLLFKILTKKPSRNIFLVDFACYKGKPNEVYTKEKALSLCKHYNGTSDGTLQFVSKMYDRTGVGRGAYVAEALLRDPPNPCLAGARKEAEDVLFEAVDKVLENSGVQVEDIGIIIVNCTVFNTVPCLADMIANKYKFRDDVLCYNLTGMGCSAGLAAVGLAKQLLQVRSNTYCLVISTENITENFYKGENCSMIIANTLFRLGGSAILLSNRSSDSHISKYQLIHTVHNITASHDRSFKCIVSEEDKDGKLGVSINKDLMIAAFKAIEDNVTALARVALPVSDQIKFLINYIIRRYLKVTKIKPYVPNFGNKFDHIFSHVGSIHVLDELQKNLGFSKSQMEPSKMTLYRFGNTSSSSVWYALAYSEAKGRIKKGDQLWQIAFGSGFKCTSVIWRALRNADIGDKNNPWKDEIYAFPLDVSKIEAFPLDVSKIEASPTHSELFKET